MLRAVRSLPLGPRTRSHPADRQAPIPRELPPGLSEPARRQDAPLGRLAARSHCFRPTAMTSPSSFVAWVSARSRAARCTRCSGGWRTAGTCDRTGSAVRAAPAASSSRSPPRESSTRRCRPRVGDLDQPGSRHASGRGGEIHSPRPGGTWQGLNPTAGRRSWTWRPHQPTSTLPRLRRRAACRIPRRLARRSGPTCGSVPGPAAAPARVRPPEQAGLGG